MNITTATTEAAPAPAAAPQTPTPAAATAEKLTNLAGASSAQITAEKEQAEAPTPETEAPAAKEEAAEDDVSKRMRKLIEQQKKLDAKKAELKKYEPLERALAEKDKNPFAVLDASGLTLEQLIEYKLNNGQPAEPKPKTVEEQLEELKAQLREKEEQAQRANAQQVLEKFKTNVISEVSKNSEKYELLNSLGYQQQVFDSVYEIVTRNPEKYQTEEEAFALVPQVADLIEQELTDTLKKASNAKKVKTLFGVALESTQAPEKPQSAPTFSATITNKAAAPVVPKQAPQRKLTLEERKAEVARQLAEMQRAKKS